MALQSPGPPTEPLQSPETSDILFPSRSPSPRPHPDPTQHPETDPKQTQNRLKRSRNGAKRSRNGPKSSRNGPKSSFSGWDGRGVCRGGGCKGKRISLPETPKVLFKVRKMPFSTPRKKGPKSQLQCPKSPFWGFKFSRKWHFSDFKVHFGVSGLRGSVGGPGDCNHSPLITVEFKNDYVSARSGGAKQRGGGGQNLSRRTPTENSFRPTLTSVRPPPPPPNAIPLKKSFTNSQNFPQVSPSKQFSEGLHQWFPTGHPCEVLPPPPWVAPPLWLGPD